MQIKILGSGCAKCSELERLANEAVTTLGLDATVEHVADIGQIMSFGVMTTPALVVDGEVRVAGRVPSAAEMLDLFKRGGTPGVQGGCSCGGNCC
ncbi:MAG: thioredoxin family protein [Coriobacteriia bacterium]|nr:thioredoxin family protein [Coriobacteriia bacterium]